MLHRSEALAAAMTGRRTIAVAGTHGKTTTTSMVTSILQHCGLDPSFVIGGEISEVGSNAHHGTGEHFVAEADESDSSFLHYRPYVAIVTNVDADHLNTYGDLAGLSDAFLEFAQLVEPDGFVVTCADDPGGRAAGRPGPRRRPAGGDLRRVARRRRCACPSCARPRPAVRYLATLDGEPLGEVSLPIPGRHMGLNSAAAVLTALRLGLPLDQVRRRAGRVPGGAAPVRAQGRRRRRAGLRRVRLPPDRDDRGAGHPARRWPATGRLLVVFQPYRVYRTRDLRAEIAAALALADEAIVMEVFGPGEARGPGRRRHRADRRDRAAARAQGLRRRRGRTWPAEVCRRAREGDVVVTMGAPPISLLGDELLDRAGRRRGGRDRRRA